MQVIRERNQEVYVHENRKYKRDVDDETLYWCTKKDCQIDCQAYMIKENNTYEVFGVHAEPYEPFVVETYMMVEEILAETRKNPWKRPVDVLKMFTDRNPEVGKHLKKQQILNRISKIRKELQPDLPDDMDRFISVADDYFVTKSLTKISVDVVHPEHSSVMLFVSFDQALIEALNLSNEIMLDRNHLIVPDGLSCDEVVTVHVIDNCKKIFLAMIIIVERKSQEQVLKMYEQLYTLCPRLRENLKRIYVGYEEFDATALRQFFPNALVMGTWYHYNKSQLEMADHLDLDLDEELINAVISLPMITPDKAEQAQQFILSLIRVRINDSEGHAKRNLVYFENLLINNWFTSMNKIKSSVKLLHLTHYLQSFDRMIRKQFGTHPNSLKFLCQVFMVLKTAYSQCTSETFKLPNLHEKSHDTRTIKSAIENLHVERIGEFLTQSLRDFIRRYVHQHQPQMSLANRNRVADPMPAAYDDTETPAIVNHVVPAVRRIPDLHGGHRRRRRNNHAANQGHRATTRARTERPATTGNPRDDSGVNPEIEPIPSNTPPVSHQGADENPRPLQETPASSVTESNNSNNRTAHDGRRVLTRRMRQQLGQIVDDTERETNNQEDRRRSSNRHNRRSNEGGRRILTRRRRQNEIENNDIELINHNRVIEPVPQHIEPHQPEPVPQHIEAVLQHTEPVPQQAQVYNEQRNNGEPNDFDFDPVMDPHLLPVNRVHDLPIVPEVQAALREQNINPDNMLRIANQLRPNYYQLEFLTSATATPYRSPTIPMPDLREQATSFDITCGICLTNASDCLFEPCKCLAACASCTNQMLAHAREYTFVIPGSTQRYFNQTYNKLFCPMCNQKSTNVKQVQMRKS